MAGEDWLAALVGSLQGGVEGLQFMQRSKQDEKDRKAKAERQRQIDADAAEDRTLRRAELQRLGLERARGDANDLLTSLGRDSVVSPEQAAQVSGAGLGHRLRPEETLASSFFSGYTDPSDAGLAGGEMARTVSPGRPTGRAFVAPTRAEQLADQERAKEQERLARVRGGIADPYEQQAFDANPSGYKPTRESFVPLPIRQREAVEAEDAKIGAEVRKGEALLPIKLREKEEGERIQAKYRPAKERGPTDYQTFGMIDKLNARFNSNTKATREVARQYQVMQTSWRALEKGTGKGTAEQGIVSTFNKILDPDSVVREGEYDRTAQGQALLTRMRSIADNLKSGGQVSRATLKDMVDLSGTYAQRAEAFTKAEQRRVGSVADRMGIDQSLIFTAEPDDAVAPPAAGGAARTASPKVGERKTFPNGNVGVWDGQNWVKQ
jgi:hypothetical protein